MAEYIVRTDKPIRLDEVMHLHGIHNYSVQRLEKHGRLIDADKCGNVLLDKFTEGLGKWDEFYSAGYRYALKYFSQAPAIVEASE